MFELYSHRPFTIWTQRSVPGSAQVIRARNSQPLHLFFQGRALESEPGGRARGTRQGALGLLQNFDDALALVGGLQGGVGIGTLA